MSELSVNLSFNPSFKGSESLKDDDDCGKTMIAVGGVGVAPSRDQPGLMYPTLLRRAIISSTLHTPGPANTR